MQDVDATRDTVEELRQLGVTGCDLGQGFFWSQARSAQVLLAWLAARETPVVPAQDRRTAATA